MTGVEMLAPSRSQSLNRMPPTSLRMTAIQKTGSEKNTNVKNVTM
ncbi:MAG: hypothetical protein R2697_05310 [Ilumatobacteraceae bacterium]